MVSKAQERTMLDENPSGNLMEATETCEERRTDHGVWELAQYL